MAQQDIEFHINKQWLAGKNILKIKRDFHDPYVWVLAANNEVFRINSLDNAIEDYTSRFSAYANSQFIDIAGVDKDFVFVATNATVLQYREDQIKVIDASYGIIGDINSIGVDYTGYYVPDAGAHLDDQTYANTLLIATEGGLDHYDYDRGQILAGSSHLPARVFEATYRSEMFSGIEYKNYGIGNYQFPVIELVNEDIFGGWVWHGPMTYGNNVNTCYYIKNTMRGGTVDNIGLVSSLMQFAWGTENGVFINIKDKSTDISQPQNHYLDGIKTNKITSIYGMTTFGSYQAASLIKENLLVGTDKGLYFSNSRYANASTTTVNNYAFKHFDDLGNVVVNDICVNATTYSVSAAMPFVCENGAWLATENGLYLITPDYSKFVPKPYQKSIFFNVGPAVNEIQVCPNAPMIILPDFTLYNGGIYQWYKDGQPIPGQTQSDLSITQGGEYWARFYDPCSNMYVESNHLKAYGILPLLNYADRNVFCDGTTVTFSTAYNPLFQYRWYKDGVLTENKTYTIEVKQSGKYKVEVSRCDGFWELSKEIEVSFVKLTPPVISTDKPVYCTGDHALLSLNVPVNPDYEIQWYKDGSLITSNTNKTSLTTTDAGKYTVTIVSLVPNVSCSKTSAVTFVTFNQVPAISLQQTIKTNLCDGQPVDLQATISSGSVKWSTGESGTKITVRHTGHYVATVTSPGGCPAVAAADIDFLPQPVLGIPDAALCPFNRQQITLTAPPGFVKYTWNGISGDNTYTTTRLGPVELTVVDKNNCTASQTINVTLYCEDLMVPNTFTPNNDGANDTWLIGGINDDPTVVVKVYNRNGTPVFESRGYTMPWDGRYNGKKLPAGTYYYIITAKSGAKVISGSVTILY